MEQMYSGLLMYCRFKSKYLNILCSHRTITSLCNSCNSEKREARETYMDSLHIGPSAGFCIPQPSAPVALNKTH